MADVPNAVLVARIERLVDEVRELTAEKVSTIECGGNHRVCDLRIKTIEDVLTRMDVRRWQISLSVFSSAVAAIVSLFAAYLASSH
jgi:hypothetical protein